MQDFLGIQHLKIFFFFFCASATLDVGGTGDGSNRRDFNEITELKGSGLLVYENRLG